MSLNYKNKILVLNYKKFDEIFINYNDLSSISVLIDSIFALIFSTFSTFFLS